MRSKLLFFTLCYIFLCSACSKQIKLFKIFDTEHIKLLAITDEEFLFGIMNFKKQYKIETYLKSFEVGICFKQPVPKNEIKLGTLEITIVFDNEKKQNVILNPVVRYFYKDNSDYKNNLVNKIYFEDITLDEKQFIQELGISIIDTFYFSSESELLITNSGSQFFFEL